MEDPAPSISLVVQSAYRISCYAGLAICSVPTVLYISTHRVDPQHGWDDSSYAAAIAMRRYDTSMADAHHVRILLFMLRMLVHADGVVYTTREE